MFYPKWLSSCLLVAGLAVALADAAAAAPAGPEGAADLAKAITAGLGEWFPAHGIRGQAAPRLTWQGDLIVEPKDEAYRVTLPKMALIFEGEQRVDFGDVAVMVTPNPDATYGIAGELPATIHFLDNDGGENATLSLARRDFTAVWQPENQLLRSFKGNFEDVRLASTHDKAGGHIGSIDAQSSQTASTEQVGRWDGPASITVHDIGLVDEAGRPILHLDDVTLQKTIRGLDALRALDFSRALRVQAAASGTDPAGAAHLVEPLRGMFRDTEIKLDVAGVTANNPQDGMTVRVSHVGYQTAVEGFDQEQARMSLALDVHGLGVDPNPLGIDFLPHDAALRLSAEHLPMTGFWGALSTYLKSAPAAPAAKKRSKIAVPDSDAEDDATDDQAPEPSDDSVRSAAFVAAITGAASDAATSLQLANLTIEAPAVGANLSGQATVKADAANGGVADFNLTLRGLDAIVKSFGAPPQPAAGATSPDGKTPRGKMPKASKPADERQSLIGVVGLIETLGQLDKDSEGREVRRYRIQYTADGKAMLNGGDLAPLLGLGRH
ncbi:MAG: hypothetical protein P4M00_21695 [Azospirillaceae bacterium]|nr:hypothetical protein [Azospirillaceae bacterium]